MAKKDEETKQIHYKADAQVLILVEACYSNDSVVAQRYGIDRRTLQNWRKKLLEDAEFSQTFALKKEEFERPWIQSMRQSIMSGANFIQRAASEAEGDTLRNPEMVRAIAGAIKICSDVILTGEMINARIAKFAGDDQPQNGKSSAPGVQEHTRYPN